MMISIQRILRTQLFITFLCSSVFIQAQDSNSESNQITSDKSEVLVASSINEEQKDPLSMEVPTSEANLPVTTIQRHLVTNSFDTTSTKEPASCQEVELEISFDEYAEDISWTIVDSHDNLVASANRYASYPKQKILAMKQCLTPGTYTFIIKDKNEDGLCCKWSRGFYHLYVSDGTSLASGASFGSRETTIFTINDSTHNDSNVSIDRVQTTEQFEYSVFPSPVKSGELLQIAAPNTVNEYVIYDTLGKKVQEGKSQQNTINVDALETGRYILEININNRPVVMDILKK